MKKISGLVNNPVSNDIIYPTQSELINYQDHLKQHGMVDISACFTQMIKEWLTRESVALFAEKSRRKDFVSKHTGTPRHMCTVSEEEITKKSEIIKDLYYSQSLTALLSKIAQEKVDYLPWTGERFVLNGLMNNQDTHGWHWDDYAYALIFIAHAPPQGSGGEVECVPHTEWIKSHPNIHHIVTTKPIHSYYFQPGSLYFMRSDTTLHRVTKIVSPYQRLSIAMSFCNQTDLMKDIDHQTVLDLYA